MKFYRLIFLVLMLATLTGANAQNKTFGNLPPLHVDGKYLKDINGNIVRLHGVMETPSPYFNGNRWGTSCSDNTVGSCLSYFNKLFTAITDTTNGAYCNVVRLHLDPCWTNDPSLTSDGIESGEADISRFSNARLIKYMRTLYFRIASYGMRHGLYVIMRPPGVCPSKIQVGGYYQEYLMKVWDTVTKNDSILKYSGQISIELANEPVTVLDENGNSSASALHDFFQPIVDKIRENGFTGIIWVPGSGWQSGYENYATYPITGYNIGYAVHVYTGWYGASDSSCDHQAFIKQFGKQVPVVETNPIMVTEIDWSPYKEGKGHYNESGTWVESNWGTWSTGSTSKWGNAWKDVHDHYGNIGMTLSGTGCYIDIDKSLATSPAKAVVAFDGNEECCAQACFDWYKEWNTDTRPYMNYSRQWTADQGNGKYINPVINGDFPDPDVIRVGDTYYMVSSTMFYFPGATILKSKDLVNWEYCANPLQQIDDNNAYNLLGAHHYAQGQWAASLNYSKGKYYLYFICYGRSGVDNTQNILLTTTDPEGKWTMTKMKDHYYDSGWLFDDEGDGYIYVACGIGDIYVNQLDRSFNKLKSTRVLSLGNGLEGCHMYHIGDYYYIYATYGGTEGSQTIFRSTSPMGPYEEHDGRIFANQHIHQGALIETQTGEWWTILFKDAGAIGRIPYLEPVVWEDGWPIIGNNGIDVSVGGKGYAKPNVGQTYQRTYLDTNDTFTEPTLGMQWEWNHNPENGSWSLLENPGYLRLHTVTVTDSLQQARNSLSQRILGYSPVGTASNKYMNSYGTIKMVVNNMQDGDIAGLAIFQEPYAYIGIKQIDGKRYLYNLMQTKLSGEQTDVLGDEIESDTVYLRAVVNFGTSKANFYYSTDNKTYTKFGNEMTMAYTLGVFVGNRFFLFNYATKQLGGYVDIDWFSTEPKYGEDYFYGPGVLHTYTTEDLSMETLNLDKTSYTMIPGSAKSLDIICTSKSGLETSVASNCSFTYTNPDIVQVIGGKIIAQNEGETEVTASYTDHFGNTREVSFTVNVSYFPLTADALNPSIYGTGTFVEKSGSLKTSQYGFGGWEYTGGADLSAFNYIIVKLRRASSAQPSFRLFDSTNYWSDCYVLDMKKTTTAVIDLHNLVTPNGRTIDPSAIFKAGFWTDGSGPIYIKSITLSMDGVNPVGIDEIQASDGGASVSGVYDLTGRKLPGGYTKGINIVRMSDGTVKKILVE